MRDVAALNDELAAAGAWVFAGGLQPTSTATVVRLEGERSDHDPRPVRRKQEPIGGCWIIKAISTPRSNGGRSVAGQARVFSVIEVPERTVQDAFAAAVPRWPSTGHPPSKSRRLLSATGMADSEGSVADGPSTARIG
jgi:hypothetical protein